MALVEAAIDVDAGAGAVWEVAATSEGMSAWFADSSVEPGDSGSVTLRFGPGAIATMAIQVWDPPRRFRFGAPDGEGGRSHDITIAATGAGCRLVLRDDGVADAEAEATREGWAGFLSRLKATVEAKSGG